MRVLEFNINAITESRKTQRKNYTNGTSLYANVVGTAQSKILTKSNKKVERKCIYAHRQEFCQIIAVGIGT